MNKRKEIMEKKYVLAKDTPTSKKGSEILEHFGTVCLLEQNYFHSISKGNETVQDALSRLLRDGWIEEVKPLEIWVNEYKMSDGFSNKFGVARSSKTEAFDNRESAYIRTVHFIEAIK